MRRNNAVLTLHALLEVFLAVRTVVDDDAQTTLRTPALDLAVPLVNQRRRADDERCVRARHSLHCKSVKSDVNGMQLAGVKT